jgi:hypothetical protein
MFRGQTDQVNLRNCLIRDATSRGAFLPYAKAERGAWGILFLRRRGLKLAARSFRDFPRSARVAARAVCGVIYDVRGIDPVPYLRELDRLDELEGLDAVARWRANRAPTIFPGRSPLVSERAWIELNGY